MGSPFDPEPDPAEEPEVQHEPNHTSAATGADKAKVPDPPAEYHPYKFTFKSGSGFEAEWFTASYRTLDEAEVDLSGDNQDQLARVLESGARVAAYFRKKGPGTQTRSAGNGGGGGSQQRSGNGKPEGATEAPSWMGEAPYCKHGERTYVTRTKDDGSAWHAWGCPSADRNNKCTGAKGSGNEGLIFKNKPKN